MEKKWGIQFILECFNEYLRERIHDISDNKKKSIYKIINNQSEEIEIELIKNLNSLTLVSCFSQQGDLLSQWRGYGDDGKGISIGFNYNKLENLLKHKRYANFLDNTKPILRLSEIYYDQENLKDNIKSDIILPLLKAIRENYNLEKHNLKKLKFEDYLENEICHLLDYLMDLFQYSELPLLFLKNPAFEEEKECRIIYNTRLKPNITLSEFIKYSDVDKAKNPVLKLSPIKHYVRNNNLVTYADLNFSNCINKELIKEIVIGSKSKVTEEELQHFLWANKFNYDINIEKSKASYR